MNSFQYDAGGRQVKAGARTVSFTDFDRPRSVNIGDVATDFRYTAGGVRAEKVTPDERTVYAFGLYEKRITAEGTQRVFYVPGDTGIVAQVTRTEPTSGDPTDKILYFTRDHLGSSSAAFTQGGAVEVQLFDPWGERIFHSGATSSLMEEVHHGFTDQRHEEDLGWIDMNARMYDPGQRRFISTDPLMADPLFSTGRNRFAYALNNPLRYSDPSGLGVEETIVHPPHVNSATTVGGVVYMPDVYVFSRREVVPTLNTGENPVIAPPAPYEQAPTEVASKGNAEQREAATEVGQTVPSGSDAALNGRFASSGGMKDWVDIDPEAVDERGRAIYECSSETNCRSIKANYINTMIGTSDVEVWLATGGLAEVGSRMFGRVLAKFAPAVAAESKVVAAELSAEAKVAGEAEAKACVGGACTCFIAGTPVLANAGLLSIETLVVGERIRTLDETECSTEAAEWVRIDLQLEGPITGVASLLREPTWVEYNGAYVGARIAINDPEIGYTRAVVQSADKLQVSAGEGCVVTGTVAHPAEMLVDIVLSSGEVLRATPAHPFFVVEKQEFVPAGELVSGMHLQTTNGRDAVVVSLAPSSSGEFVYNLEVQGAHTYVVGTTGVWVHNQCTAGSKPGVEVLGSAPKTLQSDGNTIRPATARALGMTKEQANRAMHKMKPDRQISPKMVGRIMSNGDYVNPDTGEVLGNLFDYVD